MLGQVVEARLRRADDAAAAQPAGADRGDRLAQVVGRALRVGVGCVKPVRRAAWYGLSTFTPAAGSNQRTASASGDGQRQQHGEVRPAHAGDEEHGGERRGVDERRADVRLHEDERDRHEAVADRRERRVAATVIDRARSARKPATTSTNSTFPNSDGWKVKKPTSIHRCEPRVAAPAASTNTISPSVPT